MIPPHKIPPKEQAVMRRFKMDVELNASAQSPSAIIHAETAIAQPNMQSPDQTTVFADNDF